MSKSRNSTIGTNDENIYIYWGLHFTRMREGDSIQRSKIKLAEILLRLYRNWLSIVKGMRVDKSESDHRIISLMKWSRRELVHSFRDDMKLRSMKSYT